MAKIYGQLEKAQLENTTSDTASHPKGMITYRTDLNQAKVSNGTAYKLLIDEDSSQTLSNKIYASPSLTGAITAAQTTTPANPSSGSNKLYFKADGKLYTLDSAGNEALVGSGTGGVKNLITNGNADDTSASIFVPYADAAATRPVDGTGGSPTVTTSVSSSSPLDGVKSFLLTKPASNVQGQGWSVPFTVDPAYRAKSLKISVDYIVNSGTFVAGSTTAESDVIWYIYDVTNSQLIEPSNIKMFSNATDISDKFEATFQSSSTGSSYRLIAHVQSTSASAYELKVDNITVSPQSYVFGTPVTDWVSYTPTFLNMGTGSYINASGKFRRVGDSLQIYVSATKDGSSGTGGSQVTASLPTGYLIDTTKITNSGLTAGAVLGSYVSAAAAQAGVVVFNSTTTISFYDDSGFFTGSDWNSGEQLAGFFTVPIVGLSSSVQTSDSADTRVVSFDATATGATSLPSGTLTTIAFASNGVIIDSHGRWDTTNNWYKVPVSGDYEIAAAIGMSGSTSAYDGSVRIQLDTTGTGSSFNDSVQSTFCKAATASSFGMSFKANCIRSLKAGDLIRIQAVQNSGSTLSAVGSGTAQATQLSIKRLSGPSAIAANEAIYVEVENTAATAIANITDTEIPFATKYFDSHGAFGSSRFTAPSAGFYSFDASIGLQHAGSSERRIIVYRVAAGGGGTRIIAQNAGADYELVTNRSPRGVSGKTWLNQGDQLYVSFTHNAGSSQNLVNTVGTNKFMIARVSL